MGVLNPMRDKNEGTYIPGARRDDTCDHGLLFRRSMQRVNKVSDELSCKVKSDD